MISGANQFQYYFLLNSIKKTLLKTVG